MRALFIFIGVVSTLCARGPQRQQAYVVADLDTGKILKKKNIHASCYPASLTKMMTLYLLFESLRDGQVKLTTKFLVSPLAQQQMRTRLNLKVGERVPVKVLLESLVIKSANDAAIVVAEGLAGSVLAFVNRMNAKAKKLRMTETQFRNPSGVPDSQQVSSARDMALLVRALWRDFPEQMFWFQMRSFVYKQKTHWTHNYLLNTLPGTNGMKTGYTDASGYNIAVTVERYDVDKKRRRFLCVYMGGSSGFARDQAVISLLEPLLLEHDAVYYDIHMATQSKIGGVRGRTPHLVRAMICSPHAMEQLLLQYELHHEMLTKGKEQAEDITAFLAQRMVKKARNQRKTK